MSKFDDMMDYGKNRERFNDLKRKLDTIIPERRGISLSNALQTFC